MFSRRGFLFGLLAPFVPVPKSSPSAVITVKAGGPIITLPPGWTVAHQQADQAAALGISLDEYRVLLRKKLGLDRPQCGHRATVDKLHVAMPSDAVLISSRRLATLSDDEILYLVKSHSVAIIRPSKAAAEVG